MLQLREYQRDFFARVRERYDAGVTRQLGVLATGLGKAVLFAALRDQMNFAKRIMVLVHREELAAQAADKLCRWNPHLHVGVEMADRSADVDGIFPATLIVASVPTLGRRGSSRIKKFLPEDFDAVVSDECFPAGTLIDGKPIENIRIGDNVMSYDEVSQVVVKRRVSGIFKNPAPSHLVRVSTRRGMFHCTPNHPIYTERGWINAAELANDDRVLFSLHWSRRPSYSIEGPNDALREKGTGLLFRYLQGSGCFISEIRSYDPHELETLLCADEEKQPDVAIWSQGKDDRNAETDRTQAPSARGQWDRTDPNADGLSETVGIGLGNRVRGADLSAREERVPRLLQTGHREFQFADWDRSRRQFSWPPQSSGAGQEEGITLKWLRVDDIAFSECGSAGHPGQRYSDGYVYNLEVEGTHTYFANGFLVHNCHHSSSPQWRTVLTHFGLTEPGGSILSLGLTATPNRSDGAGLRQNFDEIVFDMGIREGIESGYLVDLRGIRVNTKTNLDKVHTRAGDFAEDELADAVNTIERNAIIVKEWMAAANGLKTVVFTVDIQHAVDLAAAFTKCSVQAEAIWGSDPERKSKLYRHRTGQITVLCNCAVLTEGYDDPGIKCIVLAKPTKSALLFTQMIGRGTRIDDGKEYTLILDVVDNTKKHSVVTVPSLLGMPANLDLKGKSVIKAKEQFERVAKEFPSADLSGVLSLSNLDSIAENISLFQVNYPPEISKLSELGWRKDGDGYMLAIKRDLITIQKDLRDEYQIVGSLDGQKITLTAQNLSGAFNIADGLVSGEYVKLLQREARWHKDAPTEKQLSLARILKLAVPVGATKGMVSAAIDAKRAQMRRKA